MRTGEEEWRRAVRGEVMRETGERGGETEDGVKEHGTGVSGEDFSNISSYAFIYFHILPCTFLYLKIFNIRKVRADMRPKNLDFSGYRAFPKVRI